MKKKKPKMIIELILDNAQSQPKISIVVDGIVNENLPTNSMLTSLFDKTDNLLLTRFEVYSWKDGYNIVRAQ